MSETVFLWQTPQDVSTHYRSVDMTVLAAFATRFCLRHCVFLCKGTKLQNSAKPNSGTVRRFPVLPTSLCTKLKNSAKQNSWTVCRFSLWNVFQPLKPAFFFPNSAQAEFVGFGSWLLESHGFLCAKAPLDPLCYVSLSGTGTLYPNSAPLNSGLWLGAFGKVWLFRCQSGIRGLWLEAFGRSGFFRCQSTFAIRFCQKNSVSLCKGTKAQEFCKAEFLDSMSVLALECFSAYGTGVLISEFSAS